MKATMLRDVLTTLHRRLTIRLAQKWHKRFVILLCVLNIASLISLMYAMVIVGEEHWEASQVEQHLSMARARGPHVYSVRPVGGVRPAGSLTGAARFPPSPADNTSWPEDRPEGDCAWKIAPRSVPALLPEGWRNDGNWKTVEQPTSTWVRAPILPHSWVQPLYCASVWWHMATAAIFRTLVPLSG